MAVQDATTLKGYFNTGDTPTEAQFTNLIDTVDSKAKYHGIEASGTLSFDNSTHVVTMGSGTNTYWFQGATYTTASAITCDLDSYVTLTANTIYFVYFEDASGTLKASSTVWGLKDKVPVCTVFWNGSAGAVCDERHNHTRDLDWHTNAHLTIGARISAADFAITAPSVAAPTTVNFAGGTLWDEDLATVHGQQTNCRVWYQTGSSTYTWVDSNSIYPTNVRHVNGSYSLEDVATNRYVNMWIYASPDIGRGLYAFVETIATIHSTAAAARAITPPNLSSFGLTPELKLLYRVILKGDETFVEYTDYRSSASLPAGGTAAPSASSVTFTPSGTISATNVQAAIEEVAAEASSGGTEITQSTTAPATPAEGDLWLDTDDTASEIYNCSMLVAETVVSGSAVTSVTFSGLDGNVAGGYRVECNFWGSGENLTYLYINTDTTNSNYKSQRQAASQTAPYLSGSDAPIIGYSSNSANYPAMIVVDIGIVSGRSTYLANGIQSDTTTPTLEQRCGWHLSTITNLTSITISCSNIAVGSTFRLYRRK
jgi:hypothetical protein